MHEVIIRICLQRACRLVHSIMSQHLWDHSTEALPLLTHFVPELMAVDV